MTVQLNTTVFSLMPPTGVNKKKRLPDGLKVNQDGNLCATGPGGVSRAGCARILTASRARKLPLTPQALQKAGNALLQMAFSPDVLLRAVREALTTSVVVHGRNAV